MADPQTTEQLLRDALIEVLVWIDNWDPNFIYDDEWPATRERVQKALHPEAINDGH